MQQMWAHRRVYRCYFGFLTIYDFFFPFGYFGRLSNAQKLAIRLIRILKLRVAIRKFKVRKSALRQSASLVHD